MNRDDEASIKSGLAMTKEVCHMTGEIVMRCST